MTYTTTNVEPSGEQLAVLDAWTPCIASATVVSGHSNEHASARQNSHLGHRRALAVKNALADRGVNPNWLTEVGEAAPPGTKVAQVRLWTAPLER